MYVFVWFVGILSFSKSYDLGLITVFMVVVSVALCLFFTCFFQIFSLKWRDYLQDFCVFSVLACVFGVQYLQFVPISSQIFGLEFFLYLTLQTAMFTLYACLF